MKYLIEIEKVRDDGDLKGNDIPNDLKMTAYQLQKAIAYDLIRIREAKISHAEAERDHYKRVLKALGHEFPGDSDPEFIKPWDIVRTPFEPGVPPNHRPEFDRG